MLLQHKVLVHVRHVRHIVRLRHVPDDHVTQVAAGNEPLAAVVRRDRRHLAAVSLVDHVHRTTRLGVEAADATVAPTYRSAARTQQQVHAYARVGLETAG